MVRQQLQRTAHRDMERHPRPPVGTGRRDRGSYRLSCGTAPVNLLQRTACRRPPDPCRACPADPLLGTQEFGLFPVRRQYEADSGNLGQEVPGVRPRALSPYPPLHDRAGEAGGRAAPDPQARMASGVLQHPFRVLRFRGIPGRMRLPRGGGGNGYPHQEPALRRKPELAFSRAAHDRFPCRVCWRRYRR